MGNWIRENINLIISFCIGVIITSLLFIIFQKQKEIETIKEIEKPIITERTITKTDTIYIDRIVSKPEIITETLIRVDTIKEYMEIPIIKKEYRTIINEDSIKGEIYAEISGYKANLDTLTYKLNIPIYSTEKTITEQITKVRQRRLGIGLYIGPSYNVFHKSFDLSVGVGLTFNVGSIN